MMLMLMFFSCSFSLKEPKIGKGKRNGLLLKEMKETRIVCSLRITTRWKFEIFLYQKKKDKEFECDF